MRGQWIGIFTSQYNGEIIANIDELRDQYTGFAFLLPTNPNIPGVAISFQTQDKQTPFEFSTKNIFGVDSITKLAIAWTSIKHLYPEYTFPSQVTITGSFTETKLDLKANTDKGLEIKASLVKNIYTEKSIIKGEYLIWDDFKKKITPLESRRYLFRGQNKPWKLRTGFHRKKRYDLSKFVTQDIPALHRYLSASITHVFNLQIPEENGAFFNLVQHHGYPTPLLDWSYSPYVAAFFAYWGLRKHTIQSEPVRIYLFDHESWRKHWKQEIMLNIATPHLSLIDFLAIENRRLIPQQSATTVTNIDDIEAYIMLKGKEKDCEYLTAIDLPATDRDKVIDELSYMGITAGSMFPGLDGVCEELRERYFDN